MKRLGVSVVVSLIALVLRVGADGSAAAADWSTVTTPAPGPTQSIGFYSAGCLQGAKALPLDASPATAHMFIIKPFTMAGLFSMFSTHPPTERRIEALMAMARR